MIEIKNITKSYNGKEVLNIPELKIEKGELVGIIGNNGAGKSTLFRLILDLIAPTQGEIFLKGTPVNTSEEWKTYTGSYLDNTFLLSYLTPREYLSFIATLSDVNREEACQRINKLKYYLGDDNLNSSKYIRNLSSGNQQKVGIVAAMIHKPDLIVLDEPFNFLDPTAQANTRQLLATLQREKNTTILVSSHNLEHLLTICTRVILLEKGCIVKDIKGNANDYHNEIMSYFITEIDTHSDE